MLRRHGVSTAMFDQREMAIEADLDRLHDAREWAEAAARDFGFSADDCFQLKLATSEAVANAIQHGSESHADTVSLSVHEQEGALVFEVRDSGEYRAPPVPRPQEAERGRGLELLGRLMDRVELVPGSDGSVLRFSKRPGSRAAA